MRRFGGPQGGVRRLVGVGNLRGVSGLGKVGGLRVGDRQRVVRRAAGILIGTSRWSSGGVGSRGGPGASFG